VAKIHLSPVVKVHHVDEAHRLFQKSTLHAASSGMSTSMETPTELVSLVQKIEDALKRRVAIGTKISYPKLHEEMLHRYDNARAIDFVSNLRLTWAGHSEYGEEGRVRPLRREEDPGAQTLSRPILLKLNPISL